MLLKNYQLQNKNFDLEHYINMEALHNQTP